MYIQATISYPWFFSSVFEECSSPPSQRQNEKRIKQKYRIQIDSDAIATFNRSIVLLFQLL